MTEEWKKVPEFPKYEFSNLGNLRKYMLQYTTLQSIRVIEPIIVNGIEKFTLVDKNKTSVFSKDELKKLIDEYVSPVILRQPRPKFTNYEAKLSKGVTYREKDKYYIAQLTIDGKSTYLGAFRTEEDARNVYLQKLNEYYGKY